MKKPVKETNLDFIIEDCIKKIESGEKIRTNYSIDDYGA